MFIRLGRNKIIVRRSSDVYFLVSGILKRRQPIDREKEYFLVIGLKTNNQIKYVDIVSVGTLNGTLACGREIFKGAILKSVAGIILCHNHPSGNKNPSESDIELTNKMAEVGEYLDIHVHDHVIVTTDCGYYSFADEGRIELKQKSKGYTT